MCQLIKLAIATAFASLLGAASGQAASPDPARVTIGSGAVRGVAAADVISFKGIPYAAPPVGKLRWRAPQPAKPWHDVLNAEKFGPSCMQTDEIPKSEDCLTINIWRPAAATAKLPVMVWIYGGALVHGNSAMYPGEALARQGVIVVSLNYRMGRFGFFAFPASATEAPDEPIGNYGYMDQIAALKWVHENIAAFGGDPNNVTIFGESAGAGSVMVLLTSPLSQGLFTKAIMESPGIPTGRSKVLPVTALADAEKMAVDYAHSAGINGSGAMALAALRALPAQRIVEGTSAQQELAALAADKYLVGVAGPILDGKLIVEPPEAAVAAGHQAKVPIIIGANDRDLALGMANSKEALFAMFGPHADEARKVYDPNGDVPLSELQQQVFADRIFLEPTRHFANETVWAGQPTWWYRFSYVAGSARQKMKGAMHGMEIPYILDSPGALVGNKAVTTDDKAMAAAASGYWAAFAMTGDPNGAGRPEWPRHDPSVDRVIDFTNKGVVVGPDPVKQRIDLWQEVWDQQH
ncbi:MAG TPA: carboxylesterase family protein [Acetobacteraceae bacterium]|nr:carboxylesterase family protein [Acetobacteraceae bacterium]